MTNMINLRGPIFKKLELKRQQRTRNKQFEEHFQELKIHLQMMGSLIAKYKKWKVTHTDFINLQKYKNKDSFPKASLYNL